MAAICTHSLGPGCYVCSRNKVRGLSGFRPVSPVLENKDSEEEEEDSDHTAIDDSEEEEGDSERDLRRECKSMTHFINDPAAHAAHVSALALAAHVAADEDPEEYEDSEDEEPASASASAGGASASASAGGASASGGGASARKKKQAKHVKIKFPTYLSLYEEYRSRGDDMADADIYARATVDWNNCMCEHCGTAESVPIGWAYTKEVANSDTCKVSVWIKKYNDYISIKTEHHDMKMDDWIRHRENMKNRYYRDGHGHMVNDRVCPACRNVHTTCKCRCCYRCGLVRDHVDCKCYN